MTALNVVRGNIEKIAELSAVVHEWLPGAFPVGMVVHWDHGRHVRSGTVDMHSTWGDHRVRVVLKTGNWIWLSVTQLHEYESKENSDNE